MKAMVLTAGEGARLRPLTERTPKALLPVGGVPLLDYTLRWLADHGVSAVILNLHHQGHKIRSFVGDGSRYRLKVFFSHEEHLLGTAGGVKRVAHLFDDTFAVVYGDVLTDMDLGAMIARHRHMGALATVAVYSAEDVGGKGVVEVDDAGWVRSFVEKPTTTAATRSLMSLVNAGVYVFEPKVLDHIEPGFSDFGADAFPRMLERGVPVYAWCLRPDGYLLDIGTPEAYELANKDAAEERIHVA